MSRSQAGAGAAALLLAILVALPLLGAAPVGATEIDAETFRTLAARAAQGDESARRRLDEVGVVDGRPVDVAAALADASPDEERARLAALVQSLDTAETSGGQGPDPSAEAREILAGPDYREESVPRPLAGALRRLGGWLRPLGRPFANVWDWLAADAARLIPAALVVLAAAALVTARLSRSRGRWSGGGPGGDDGRGEDPDDLDRLAVEAERAGDVELAVRLRFRAGLLRLDAAGALDYRPSLTSGAVRRAVPSPTLSRLAADLDEIVYGGRPATPDDAAAAREGWPRVLREVPA